MNSLLFTKLSVYVNLLVYINCCTRMGMGVSTMCATTVFTVFENIKSSDPWMDAKLNSITHKKKVFQCFELVWLISFQKVLIWPPQKFFPNIFNMGIKKHRIWCRLRIRWKSIKKVFTKKVRGLRIFVHSTKRWKST